MEKNTKKPIVTKSDKKTKQQLPEKDPMQRLTGATSIGDATIKHEVKKEGRKLEENQMKHFGKHIKSHKKHVFSPLLIAHHHYRMLVENIGEEKVTMYKNDDGDFIVQQCDGNGDAKTLKQQGRRTNTFKQQGRRTNTKKTTREED